MKGHRLLMAKRELLFRLTKKDFEVTHIRGTGPGGQHKNKKSTGVRIKHPESGAVAQSTEYKSQVRNKKAAFNRLVESKKFKAWHRLEVGRHTLSESEAKRIVERMMAPTNLRVETLGDSGWHLLDDEGAGPEDEGKEETSSHGEPPGLDRLT